MDPGGTAGAGELRRLSSSGGYGFSQAEDVAAGGPVRRREVSDGPLPPDCSRPAAALAPARYRECMRNHAASVGGLVVDGCGEFLPAEGRADALRCAVCGCHRSFHRKEADGPSAAAGSLPRTPAPPYYYRPYQLNGAGVRGSCSILAARMMRTQPPPPLLALPPPDTRIAPITAFPARGRGDESSGGGTTTESSGEELEARTPVAPAPAWASASPPASKRFRTKFTAEQRGRMVAFAEAIGWRMQRSDAGAVDGFCSEVGVPRKVFKVWMHNNKHRSHRHREEEEHPSGHQELQQPP